MTVNFGYFFDYWEVDGCLSSLINRNSIAFPFEMISMRLFFAMKSHYNKRPWKYVEKKIKLIEKR